MTLQPLITRLQRWLVAILLVWVAVTGTILAYRTSMTTDEGIHVASAYLAIERGDLRFDPEHPFFFKYLTALPLFLLPLNLPPDDQALWDASLPTFMDSWRESRTWADQWFYASGNNAELMIFLARLPGVGALVLLCWLVYYTTKKWFGEQPARWALFFAAFSPTLLAHGSLTNTDVPLACTTILTLWALWRYFEFPTWKQAAWVGLSLAVALTTKFSAVILLPIALFWLIYTAYIKKVAFRRVLPHFLLALFIIWLWIWTIYQWKSPFNPTGEPNNYVLDLFNSGLQERGLSLEGISSIIRWILPSDYLKGLFFSLGGSYFGRASYILGMRNGTGVWYYFPTVFFFKTQIIALILGVTGLLLHGRSILSLRSWKSIHVLLGVTTLLLLFVSITSKLNLGIRHISPLFPLLFIGLGVVAAYYITLFRSGWVKGGIILLYALPVFLQFNQLLAYTNSFIPVPQQTYRYMHDSNIDWGQSTRELAEIIKERYPNQTIATNYWWNGYGFYYYGVSTTSFNPLNPPRNVPILVTATNLADPDYKAFRHLAPDYRLSKHSFFFIIQ